MLLSIVLCVLRNQRLPGSKWIWDLSWNKKKWVKIKQMEQKEKTVTGKFERWSQGIMVEVERAKGRVWFWMTLGGWKGPDTESLWEGRTDDLKISNLLKVIGYL